MIFYVTHSTKRVFTRFETHLVRGLAKPWFLNHTEECVRVRNDQFVSLQGVQDKMQGKSERKAHKICFTFVSKLTNDNARIFQFTIYQPSSFVIFQEKHSDKHFFIGTPCQKY